jgi:hypothetical protein
MKKKKSPLCAGVHNRGVKSKDDKNLLKSAGKLGQPLEPEKSRGSQLEKFSVTWY